VFFILLIPVLFITGTISMTLLKKISFYILLLSSFLMGLYGIGLIIKPGLMLSGLEQYSSTILTNQNTFFQKNIAMLIQLLGCFNIVAAVSGIIAIAGYKKTKTLKYLLIIFCCNIVAYGCSVTFDLTTGVIGIIEMIEIVVFFLSLFALINFVYNFKRNDG
jgi:hypothetical protein